jgi:hypothetical protein
MMRISLIHSEGWKWAPWKLIQRLPPRTLVPKRATDADAVGPVDGVDETVVVDQRDEEHQDEADGEEADLLVVEAVELGVEGGGLDLEDGDEGEQEDEAE